MPKHKKAGDRPASEQIRQEIRRVENRSRFGSVLRNTLAVLLSVAAIAVLVATFLLPVMRIYGNNMSPGIAEGEIVVAVKTSAPEKGDVIAFYYNNRILVRRIIAVGGDLVSIDEFGNVSVNNVRIREPYVSVTTAGTSDIEYPCYVQDDSYFVLSDNRHISIDSRNSQIGCVSQEDVIGKVFCCVWPFPSIRLIPESKPF